MACSFTFSSLLRFPDIPFFLLTVDVTRRDSLWGEDDPRLLLHFPVGTGL